MRATPPGSMLPPVTFAPCSENTMPDRLCSAVWVRMIVCRRSQSIATVTSVPGSGARPTTWWTSSPLSRSVKVSVMFSSAPGHERLPVSPGWPPPRA